MALEITDNNFEELLASGNPLVVDFWAEWCGPCRMIAPIVETLAETYSERVIIGKVDIESNPAIVARFGIRNIPTLIFFKDGKQVDKTVGVITETVVASKIEAMLR
jgi:thioredoxin 1